MITNKRAFLTLAALVLSVLPAVAQQQVIVVPRDADDASIAAAQTNTNVNALGMVYDGSVWRRITFGTAGTASTQVSTIQGIAGMFAVKVDGSAVTQPISAASLPLPALAATSTKQSDGTQKTQIVDGAGAVIASTSNNLNVQCANCSGSGVSAADEASFTAGTSLFAGAGGVFQTTATSNALTNGQQGLFQVTANRALFSNLRNAAGTEVGTTGAPFHVNVTQFNGVTPLMGNGVAGTGAQRVTIASDNTAFSVNATIANPSPNGTESATYATGGTTLPFVIGLNQVYNAGGSGTWGRLAAGQAAMNASLPVTIATNQATFPVSPVTTATTTDAALTSYATSAASTNATSVKASAGNVYMIRAVNTTATLYYLRLYNLATSPTCSSATGFVETIPIPASATGAGIVAPQSFGQGFTTGIAYCVTGGGASTDNTNAATGVFITILYK